MYVLLLRFFSCKEAGQTQCSNLFEIRPVWAQIAELAAFECQNLYEENENGQHSCSFIFVLIRSSSFFAGNMDNHKVSDEFDIRPDPTRDCCPNLPLSV